MHYMGKEKGYYPDKMDEVKLDKITYYKVKEKALLRLAFSLRNQVLKQNRQSKGVELV